jgi:hypothetical protein
LSAVAVAANVVTGLMRRGLSALAATLAAAIVFASAAQAAPDAPIANTCKGVNGTLVAPCYGADVVVRDVASYCRWADVTADETCAMPVEPAVSESAIAAYESSWVHHALGLQYSLANDMPLRNAPWVGTHNSFNSIAEMGPTVSDTDANQQVSLVDQLRIDIRSLELDLHWFPSVSGGAIFAPVVCHAESLHEGCSIEKQLSPVLDEIAGWLRGHRDQVLLLYLEDHLSAGIGNGDVHNRAVSALQGKLGSMIYRPAGPGCAKLPLDLTRAQVLAAGAQVVLASGCGTTAGWRGLVFDWNAHVEERPKGYQDYPSCGPDFTRSVYDSNLVRYYEDSTWLTTAGSVVGQSSVDDGLTPATTAAMWRCGVDLTGFDQLRPDDGKLAASVWSWAQSEPSTAGDCAIQRADGRFEAHPCTESHPAACRTPGGAWTVTAGPTAFADAAAACTAAGATFAVPRTGYENQLLKTAAAGTTPWLGYVRDGSRWRALDTR